MRINYYLHSQLCPLSVKILGHSEKLMRIFYERIIKALMANKFEKPESFVGHMRNVIVPFKQ
jgi:hypothetical protein